MNGNLGGLYGPRAISSRLVGRPVSSWAEINCGGYAVNRDLRPLFSGDRYPDTQSGEKRSEHDEGVCTEQRQLVNDTSGVQRFVFSGQPIPLSEGQRMGNPFAWGQILVHAENHEVVQKKHSEIEGTADGQNEPRYRRTHRPKNLHNGRNLSTAVSTLTQYPTFRYCR